MRRLLLTGFLLTLAGCQIGLPGKPDAMDAPVTAAGIAGDAIEVTTLDAVGTPAEAVPAAPDEVPPPEAPAPARVVKSPGQLACERRGGSYARAGAGGAFVCVRATRDGGKQCRKESDCESACLARSRTCSPITPLLGCNDILQNDGRRVTLCLD